MKEGLCQPRGGLEVKDCVEKTEDDFVIVSLKVQHHVWKGDCGNHPAVDRVLAPHPSTET